MRFSLNFVKEFLGVKAAPAELASLLTMAGMEVEHFEAMGADWVFDIEVTTNRYDWLSILGISREIASCLHRELKVKYPKVIRAPLFKKKKIIIENKADCPFYIGRVIRDVEVASSPIYLQRRVSHCNINSINNVVDITNYCMLKWGNPLHAFDEDKIEGDIIIRRAKPGESFIGIDDKERKLTKENLVIADSRKVIALAGIMGAKNSEVDETTKNVFLEAAVFSPVAVRRSRRAAGVDTDSSYRFERNVSADYLEYASSQAASLIEELGKGKFKGVIAAGRKPVQKSKKIAISLSELNSYLGASFPKGKVKSVLSNLEFGVRELGRNKLNVTVPSFRFDVGREVDVYEEFCRIYGYDKIPPAIPFLTNQVRADQMYNFKNRLRQVLTLLGLREAVTFSIEGRQNWEQKEAIDIVNPLRQQEDVLRVSLLGGMVRSIRHNLNREQYNVKLFEIANVYFKKKDKYCEVPMLSIGISGQRDDFFRLKGIIESVFRCLNIEGLSFVDKEVPVFRNALRINHSQKEIGFLGKLDKKLQKEFELKQEVYFCRLDVKLLKELAQEKLYQPFSPYPVVWRDISMALERGVKFCQIEEIIKSKADALLAGMRVVDVYKAPDLPRGSFVFTLRIFYQAKNRTLTSSQAAALHDSIREVLSGKQGITLR